MADLPTVHIVVPVFNRAAVTLDFVNGVRRQSYGAIRLYVVDDESTDGTADILLAHHGEWEGMKILNSGGDAWWGGGVHKGMTEANKTALPQDCILLMNNDVNFENDLVEKLIKAHLEKPNAVLSAIPVRGGKVLRPGSNMVSWALSLTSHPFVNHKWPSKVLPPYIPIQFQLARATLYPVKIINHIGGVAYQQLPHYHGDGEISWRAVRKGFESYVVSSAPVYPKTGSTGLFNCEETVYTWKDLIKSFSDFRSINNLNHRWQFAKLAAPLYWRYFYFFSSVLKSVIRSSMLIVKQKVNNQNR